MGRYLKKVNLHEEVYERVKKLMKWHDERIGYVRTFRSVAQLVEEAIMTRVVEDFEENN